MLELSKQILQKVSFDRKLFRKELKKSIKWLTPQERPMLKTWCLVTFGALYQELILDTFEHNLNPI